MSVGTHEAVTPCADIQRTTFVGEAVLPFILFIDAAPWRANGSTEPTPPPQYSMLPYLYSYGLYSYGLYSYGLYSYGPI